MSDDRTPPDDVDRTVEDADGDAARAEPTDDPDRRDPDQGADDDGPGLSDRVVLLVSLAFGVGLAVGSVLLVSWIHPNFENLLRVRPTVAGGGVGASWQAGNADFALNLMITLVHLADIVMGLFILAMVFIHWAAFRRLAARMQPPEGRARARGTAATDGGDPGASDGRAADRSASGRSPPDGGVDGEGGDRP
jgi:hypothetical protein